MTETPEPKVSVQECGCTITEYEDERKVIAPCVPCGIYASSKALKNAADALHAVATTMAKMREGKIDAPRLPGTPDAHRG